jgi:Putative amidoligase enzyme
MPRRMGELRRLNIEWNDLVGVARQHGITRIDLPEIGRAVRVQPRAHFQIPRVEARARVARLRAEVAPFFAPSLDASISGLDTFGIEIEAVFPRNISPSSLAAKIREEGGVLCYEESYNHQTRTWWKIVPDISVSGGRELVSPPLAGEVGFESVRKVCGILTAVGCKVNMSCGLHVHVGIARHRDINTFKKILRMFIKWEKAIDSFMAPSRRIGGASYQWCGSTRISSEAAFAAATTLNQLSDAMGQPSTQSPRSAYRYRKVNLMCSRQSQTIEFRQHQGSVEIRKIEMWIRFILRAFAKAEATTEAEIAEKSDSLESVLEFLGCSESEKGYFTGRRDYFAAQPQNSRRYA